MKFPEKLLISSLNNNLECEHVFIKRKKKIIISGKLRNILQEAFVEATKVGIIYSNH